MKILCQTAARITLWQHILSLFNKHFILQSIFTSWLICCRFNFNLWISISLGDKYVVFCNCFTIDATTPFQDFLMWNGTNRKRLICICSNWLEQHTSAVDFSEITLKPDYTHALFFHESLVVYKGQFEFHTWLVTAFEGFYWHMRTINVGIKWCQSIESQSWSTVWTVIFCRLHPEICPKINVIIRQIRPHRSVWFMWSEKNSYKRMLMGAFH